MLLLIWVRCRGGGGFFWGSTIFPERLFLMTNPRVIHAGWQVEFEKISTAVSGEDELMVHRKPTL